MSGFHAISVVCLDRLMSDFLDSRHLRLVAEVARTESVTRAAERLHVTQSAVSHQLREIEDRLGTALFARSGRRMCPTPAGRLLVEAAGDVLARIDHVEHKVSQLARHIAGELRVSAHCHTGYHWLPAIVDGLRRRYPTFEVRISPEFTLNPIGALLDSNLDLAIVNDDSDDRRLRFHELFDDEHVAIVRPSHPWAERAWITPEELVSEQLYLYSRSIDDSFLVQKVLRPAGVPLQRVTYLQLTEGILEMVKAGMGVSVLPRWSIVNVIAAAQIVPIRITRQGVFRKWFAATLRDAPRTPFVDEFLRLLVQHGPAAAKPRRRRPA
jgi:LysR family transcriptional regulator for metE and metH